MSFNEFLAQIDEAYTKEQLVHIYKQYLRKVLEAHSELEARYPRLFQQYQNISSRATLPVKAILAHVWARFVDEPALFDLFRKTISPQADQVLALLVWKGEHSVELLEKQLGISIQQEKKNSWSFGAKMRPEFAFLSNRLSNTSSSYIHKGLILRLPMAIQSRLKRVYPKPKDYDLSPLKLLPPAAHRFEGEHLIFKEFPLIELYLSQNKLKTTASGYAQLSSLNRMRKILKLKEFFPESDKDKALATVRTELLAQLWLAGKDLPLNTELSLLEKIRYLFHQAFLKGAFPYTYTLLKHIKGRGRVNKLEANAYEHALFRLLKNMPEGQWFSMQGLYNWLVYRHLLPEPINPQDYVYLHTEPYLEKYYIVDREEISRRNAHHYLVMPIFKGMLFLLAAWGLVDIAYDEPDTRHYGLTYISAYDHLTALRLTPLGAYLVGQRPTYTPAENKPAAGFELSAHSLMVRLVEGDSRMLESFASPAGQNRFVVDANSFLKGCQSQSDIRTKIDLFRQTVAPELPPLWENFFKQMIQRAEPLKEVSDDFRVFELPARDPILLQLIATDEQLKKWAIKAEGYRILLNRKHWTKFKNRLRKLGYLV